MKRTSHCWFLFLFLLIPKACETSDPASLPRYPASNLPVANPSTSNTVLQLIPAANLTSNAHPLQIDAMRALGTDPVQKLVTPRLLATGIVLPLLTILADFVGILGGFLVAYLSLDLTPTQYWSTAWPSLTYRDVTFGLAQPFVVASAISLIGCYFGLATSGGTQGVGRATTQAVVASMVLIFVLNLFITRIYVSL